MPLIEESLGTLAVERLLEAKPRLHSVSPPFPLEKRKERRFATDEPARMHTLESPALLIVCRILDTSRSGLKIQVDIEISRGVLVQVFTNTLVIMAEVRHCRRGDGMYFIGLEIDNTMEIPRTMAG